MEQQVAEVGMTPQYVADLVGVHVRTIFRWIENGHLSSREGRVNLADAQNIVDAIKSSCTKLEVRRKLGICCATMRNWKDRGVLQFIEVVGTERVLRSSVDRVLETKKGRKANFHPDYVRVWDVLKVTGLEYKVLNGHIESGAVKSEFVNGKRMIPVEEYHRIKQLMDSTLRPTEVARILQKSKDAILDWRKNGRLREVVVFGNNRVAIDSVATTPAERRRLEAFLKSSRSEAKQEQKQKLEAKRKERESTKQEKARLRKLEAERLRTERLETEKLRKLEAERLRDEELERERQQAEVARLEAERVEAERLRQMREARAVELRPITVPELGSLKVLTCKQASERIGKSIRFVEELFAKGTLRGRIVDEAIYIIASSLDVYEARLKK